jgi:hypothetical protein
MPLERDRFIVHVNPMDDGEPIPHHVTISHQDKLRGELEHHRAGAPADGAFLNLTTAWCWASLVRAGEYTGPYTQFRDFACAGIEKDDPVEVPPTQPETTGDSA